MLLSINSAQIALCREICDNEHRARHRLVLEAQEPQPRKQRQEAHPHPFELRALAGHELARLDAVRKCQVLGEGPARLLPSWLQRLPHHVTESVVGRSGRWMSRPGVLETDSMATRQDRPGIAIGAVSALAPLRWHARRVW